MGKNFGSEKYVWSIRCVWSEIFFGLKIIFDPKNFWTEQISTPKTICLKNFWVQILFRLKQVQTLYRRCVAVQSMIWYPISQETIYDTVNFVIK